MFQATNAAHGIPMASPSKSKTVTAVDEPPAQLMIIAGSKGVAHFASSQSTHLSKAEGLEVLWAIFRRNFRLSRRLSRLSNALTAVMNPFVPRLAEVRNVHSGP